MSPRRNQVDAYLRVLLTDFYSFIAEEAQKGPAQLVPNLYTQIANHETYDSLVNAVVSDSSLVKFFPALRETDRSKLDIGF